MCVSVYIYMCVCVNARIASIERQRRLNEVSFILEGLQRWMHFINLDATCSARTNTSGDTRVVGGGRQKTHRLH